VFCQSIGTNNDVEASEWRIHFMGGITFLMIAAQNDMLHCILFDLDSLPKFGIILPL
jgi:hypothetical protein